MAQNRSLRLWASLRFACTLSLIFRFSTLQFGFGHGQYLPDGTIEIPELFARLRFRLHALNAISNVGDVLVIKYVWAPSIKHVDMKTRRAKMHLDSLESAATAWLNGPPYTIVEKDDVDKGWRYYFIHIHTSPEDIPMLAGDFVCCLRSALDQLAWNLAHLDPKRHFSRAEERNIHFPIFKQNTATYTDRLGLFPTAVAKELDAFQPYIRGNAYRDDLLWQLNELWILDKHRTIPANCNFVTVVFRIPDINWDRQSDIFDQCIVVRIPLSQAWISPVDLKPSVSLDILFGEFMGEFEVPVTRLREIYDFVTNDVIPRFTGFFP